VTRIPTLTKNNYFKFGYNNEWFRLRQSPDEVFTVDFDRCTRMPKDWRTETIQAARDIYDSTDLPIQVMFSGGIDSEVVVQAFQAAGVPFSCAIMRFNKGYNQHDIKFAIDYCTTHSIPKQMYELDLDDFYEGGRLLEYADAVKACSSHQCVTMWLADQLDGYPVIGQGEGYLSRIDHEATAKLREDPMSGDDYVLMDRWQYREKERMAAWYRFFLLRERDGAPGFHQYTPEQLLSYISDPGVMSVVSRNLKYSTATSKPVIYGRHFGLRPRDKFTGFEQALHLTEKWQPFLHERHIYADQTAYFEYHEILDKLAVAPLIPDDLPFVRDDYPDGVSEVDYEDCVPLLRKLWPDKVPTPRFDDTLKRIKVPKSTLKPTFLIHAINGIPVGTTHAYRTGDGEVRIRGTYVEPEYRRTSIASDLVLEVLKLFPDCHTAYTYPRVGSEQFYQSLGFEITGGPFPIYKGIYEAEKSLRGKVE
jgi:hypothetical protein